jgi:beta-mannosidase
MAGRVRAVSLHHRSALADGWEVASAPPGAIADASALAAARLAFRATARVDTAAGALRAAGEWSFDAPGRRFDGEDWFFRRAIDAPALDPGERLVLGLDGVATLADVWLDGAPIASSESMFLAHEIDVTERLAGPARLSREAELVIRCRAIEPWLAAKKGRPRWRVPMIEQQQLRFLRTTLLGRTPGWSPPAPCVGPYRPVWLERRTGLRVDDVAIDARLEGDTGVVEVSAALGAFDGVAIDGVTLVVSREGREVRAALEGPATPAPPESACDRYRGVARVESPARWWPHTHGEPARYDVALEIRRAGAAEAVRVDLGATGFRTLEVVQADGDFAVRVNGVPVFCRGACWTPLDVVSLAAAAEAQRAAVAQARAAGMNMLRVGGTMAYEDDAFHDALDAEGVLLWQDLMFANMDYPEDDAFVALVGREIDQLAARLEARPSVAVVCGNSEGEQQAAMWGATRDRWSPRLFHEVIPARLRERARAGASPIAYVPSSAHGGAFPHQASAGPTSYYGVGAYLRPLEDARRAEVRFASECLAFANVPAPSGLPGGPALRVHHAAWKARSPRDLGAGWDFDDVRDHYVGRLFGVDPAALRTVDHERYLALGRVATGEVMAATFAEWRRARSTCRGGLVWFLRDLWPGAGWGVVDAHGEPKPAWHALRRALAPIALAISDEGVNGLALHVVNDTGAPIAARLEIELFRGFEISVGRARLDLDVPAHAAREIAAAALFDGFYDLSYAYRFGPPPVHVVAASLLVSRAGSGEDRHERVAEAVHLPAGAPPRELDVGLRASAALRDDGDVDLTLGTRRFAHAVSIDAPGFAPDDDWLHLSPGRDRVVRLRRRAGATSGVRGTVTALNAETTARFEARAQGS